jgi:signal transduction histidine kinase
MNLRHRLTGHFYLYLLTLFATVCAIAVCCTYLYVFHWIPARNQVSIQAADLLRQMPAATRVVGGQVRVNSHVLHKVKQQHAWLQVLDANGREVVRFSAPANIPHQYPPGLLVYMKQQPKQFGYSLYVWYDKVSGHPLTWVYGVPFPAAESDLRQQWVFLGTLFCGSLLATLVLGLLFGRRLGGPLLHMLAWLQRISAGEWSEPARADGTPRSRSRRSGRLRGAFRVYREVLQALAQLADTLRQSEEQRRRLEQTREEWITGVSHDLKTPLASVKGYAALLSEGGYEWTPEEVRQFARVMVRQAGYMEDLIEDLSLTFRLKNQALPLRRTAVNLVELVRRAVIDLVNHPATQKQQMRFEAAVENVVYPVDPKWFKRALDNLLANASLHNPPGTRIEVRVEALGDGSGTPDPVRIVIADDGEGMDAETVARMFDRYYRGTNTSERSSRGSGLGSAIAKQLVEAHGGSIAVHTAPGRGTEVEILLPGGDGNSMTI